MTTQYTALAAPRKQFFLEMFTRDISLEDCALDLIDNSLDSLIQKEKVDVNELVFGAQKKSPRHQLPFVKVTCNSTTIQVEDNCGGIDFENARSYVFCFGHKSGEHRGRLGAYGIGLKRAMFKMGNLIDISSRTVNNGFDLHLNVKEWAIDEDNWEIPISKMHSAKSATVAGTKITITELHDEVRMRIKDGTLIRRLTRDVAQTYAFFLDTMVVVDVNDDHVSPDPVPIGQSNELQPARDGFEDNGVKVTLIASIAPPGSQRVVDKAGWYILCNGRVVLRADKTDTTGWGVGLPQFHNKYTRFVGIALFESDNPLDLPWTTTKRNVNRESAVFQRARNMMVTLTKPITRFLDDLYPRDPEAKPEYRDLLSKVESVNFGVVASRGNRIFEVKAKAAPPEKKTARVVYNVPSAAVDKVRRCIKRPAFSPSDVGKYTFHHFLKTECSD